MARWALALVRVASLLLSLALVHSHDQLADVLTLLSHSLPREPAVQTDREIEVHHGVLRSQSESSHYEFDSLYHVKMPDCYNLDVSRLQSKLFLQSSH